MNLQTEVFFHERVSLLEMGKWYKANSIFYYQFLENGFSEPLLTPSASHQKYVDAELAIHQIKQWVAS